MMNNSRNRNLITNHIMANKTYDDNVDNKGWLEILYMRCIYLQQPFIFVNLQNVYNAATTNLGSNHQVVP